MSKRIIAAALFASLFATPAWAEDAFTCIGENLMTGLAAAQPELVATIDDAAAKVRHGEGLLWRVTKPGVAPSHVFGTMHLSDPRLLDLPPAAEKAFAASTTLALEITEILDPAAMAGQAMAMMKYTAYLDGTSLDTRMSDEQRKVVEERLRSEAGLPWSVAQRMKPWVVMGAIALPGCEVARKRAGQPFLDMKLGQRAKADGKTIAALETLEGQMQAMSALPEDMMVKALVDTAKLGDRLDDIFETMIVLYERGETARIWSMLQKLGEAKAFADLAPGADAATADESYTAFQRVVVDNRNVGMAEKSAELAEVGGAFIAMGALHLPGEKGVLRLLEEAGFIVERVEG